MQNAGGSFRKCSLVFSVSCIETIYIILETINHLFERGSKMFCCFLYVRKGFDTVWIDGLRYKLFTELGINGRMWVAIKDLYTNVEAQVLYSGSLSRMFGISKSTGQGRILCTKFTQTVF